ncbi:MAG: RagB/SusD family nutrient uptake outer membrane protein, partial [Bacteroidetes bacterium]
PINSDKHQELGIPLVLEPVLFSSDFHFPVRATIAEVYEQAKSDIETAIDLPEFIGRGRASKYTAKAYLARIAFQMEDYPLTAEMCSGVIDSGNFELTTSPLFFFRETGNFEQEEIWVFPSSADEGIGYPGLVGVFRHPGYPASITADIRENGFEKIVTSEQLAVLESLNYNMVDLRVDPGILFQDSLIYGDSTLTNKYEGNWLGLENDTPNARLAEFMLMKAECLALEGLFEPSVDLLNEIRARSLRVVDADNTVVPDAELEYLLFEASNFQSIEDLREAIILERRVELAFEGNYFHDLMRLKRPIGEHSFDSERLRLPVPQREMDTNPKLVQNPGY